MGMAIRDTDKYAFVTPEKNTGYGGGGGVSS
jgi:hypothetical protein